MGIFGRCPGNAVYRLELVFGALWVRRQRSQRREHPGLRRDAFEDATHGRTATLDACAYSLPGYRFVGWNTSADGQGTSYADKAEFNGDTYGPNTNLVLYAQWEPLDYEVTLQVEDPASGTTETKTTAAKFDQPVTLSWEGKVPSENITGWEGLGLGSFYPYGSTATNLCSINEDGSLSGNTYNAVLSENGMAYLSITQDGKGVDLGKTAVELTSESTTFTPTFKALGNGLYAAQGIPEGKYALSIDGWDTEGDTLVVDSQGNGSVHLNYYSVRVSAAAPDDSISAWIDAGDGKKVQEVEHLHGDRRVTIGASVDSTGQAQGLCFDEWTAGGTQPESWVPTQAEQQVTVTNTVAFTAHAKSIEYQIAFDPNCDDSKGSMPVQYQVYGESQTLYPNLFERNGYDFAGWTTTKEWTGEEIFTDKQEVMDLATEDGAMVTLYAQWTPYAYYIQFNPNGADPSDLMPLQQFRYDLYDSSTTLSACTYKRANHHFVGWNTKADGSGVSFEDEAAISQNLSEEKESVVTLYAQWEHDAYTVDYDANGGVGDAYSQTILAGASERLDTCQFTHEGYTFAGWNTSADGSGTAYEPNAALTEDLAKNGESITLYAQWKPVNYSVHFDANAPASASTQIGGTMDDQEMSFDQSARLSWCEYVLPGYTFTGWNTAPDGSGTSYDDLQEVSNLSSKDGDTITLYAQWEAQTYTVNLYLDTDEATLLKSVEATFDEAFSLPVIEPSLLPADQVLLGWETLAFGSFYADQAHVINLCSIDDKGAISPTNLYAKVGEIGSSYIIMTNDNTPVDLDDPKRDITLKDTQSGVELSGGFEKHDRGTYKANGIPAGTYSVSIDGWNTKGATIDIDSNSGGMLVLTYCTVETASEDHALAWVKDPAAAKPEQVSKIERVLIGSQLDLGASVDEGYTFESWTATGIAPDWQVNPETGSPGPTLQE
ncbi:MAG: InlB B-repeat-containing protein, partial [Eggerthellaceae bacterium]